MTTCWKLNATAGVNLAFEGVYEKGLVNKPGCGFCTEYADRVFNPTLKLDLSGQINVTEQAAIQFSASNVTNSAQNQTTLATAPWLLGRTYWIGSALRF